MENLRCILLIMKTATGLKVYWSKSALSAVRDIPIDGRLAKVLECEMVPLPTTYLGLPLGAKSSSIDIWNPAIERMGRN